MSFVTHLARRFLALIAAFAALWTMWLFANKPLVWEWMGRPSEVYPEMAFAVFGLPASVAAIASAGWIVWKVRPSAEPSRTLTITRVINVIALAICVWLGWYALSAFLGRA